MYRKYKLPKIIQNFLMLDVYEKLSMEDKEFLNALLLVVKVVKAFSMPISFVWIIPNVLSKKQLA